MIPDTPPDSPEYRVFTVEEANNLIPELESYFAENKKLIAKMEKVIQEKKKIAEGNGSINLNPPNNLPDGLEFVPETLKNMGKLGEELRDKGVIIKDENSGLVDFPHLRNGRVVFLCWQAGEKKISFWHEVDAGKAGRKPL